MERWQAEPFLRSAWTDVLRVEPRGERWVAWTEPTILYPEGGGQPADHGTIAGVPVVDVQHGADGVEHTLIGPVACGLSEVVVDWDRRFDHMQQHTGQHLLTATLLARHGIGTTSFHLGPEHVAIEVDAPELSAAASADVVEAIQRIIEEDRPIRSRILTPPSAIDAAADPGALAALGVRSRKLPQGFAGEIRVVEIDGVDVNTCGGTHLERTGQLGAFLITQVERVGKRGSRIGFVFGRRVAHVGRALLDHQSRLNAALSCGPDTHLAAIHRLVADRRALEGRLEALEEERAHRVVEALAADPSPRLFTSVPGGAPRWMSVITARLAERRPEALILLVAPDSGGVAGGFWLAGPPAEVAALGPRVAAAADGRGGGAKGRFQGQGARVDRLTIASLGGA